MYSTGEFPVELHLEYNGLSFTAIPALSLLSATLATLDVPVYSNTMMRRTIPFSVVDLQACTLEGWWSSDLVVSIAVLNRHRSREETSHAASTGGYVIIYNATSKAGADAAFVKAYMNGGVIMWDSSSVGFFFFFFKSTIYNTVLERSPRATTT